MSVNSPFLNFQSQFDTQEKCLSYLANYKGTQPYSCLKCGHDNYYKGRTRFHRKCVNCDYDESATAHTLFHKCKIPLVKAFWMVYWVSNLTKGMSTCELKSQLGLTQKTTWFWKRKIQEGMKSTEEFLLESLVHVDEMMIGGPESGRPGRSDGKKKKVAVAVEIRKAKITDKPSIHRAYGMLIDDFSAKSLKEFLDKTVAKSAVVKSDGWKPYSTAVGSRTHIVEKSNNGLNYKLLHNHIMNLKGWIRGIHHHISKKHTQAYMDEAHFRFNRRNSGHRPIIALNRMLEKPWFSYKMATRDVSI